MTTRSQRNCRKKIRYESESDAKAASEYFMKHNGTSLNPYGCKECGMWHLTKEQPHE